jgi:serine/threonine-protein kinase SRPK3
MADQPHRKDIAFLAELQAMDPKVLATAMGGYEPPEEPFFKTYEEGFGYYTSVAANRQIKQYELMRKVSAWRLAVTRS